MNSTPQNIPSNALSPESNAAGSLSEPVLSSAEATLQLIARLPSPQGLEDRVIAGIQAAPRTGHVLHWPRTMSPRGAWMRGAAAAAIVFVVAGGGWGVYKSVQPSQPAKVLVMPGSGAPGGFSGAGAIRTPDTLRGPVVAKPATAKTNQAKAVRKTSARAIHAPLNAVQPAAKSLSIIPPKDSGSQPKVSAAR